MVDVGRQLSVPVSDYNLGERAATHFVRDSSGHISLGSFDRTESFAEVELNVVTFSLHAYPEQDPTLGVKVKPVLTGNEITKMRGIQFERGPADAVVIPQGVPIPDGGNDI